MAKVTAVFEVKVLMEYEPDNDVVREAAIREAVLDLSAWGTDAPVAGPTSPTEGRFSIKPVAIKRPDRQTFRRVKSDA